eukprot:CAMPEP_0168387632 /NCGR_PEP_ID=MMETSP0228-20121227/16043_1 /TAXON_ID=133427 /ORGANISM="Protoceratium reticulatum, Strain CCCM 535 (=CCMP 1889)" /LENGTH=166 /DNA_ID=CAMNT_0008400869 /DNA_START=49 /DNA_END=546 /DNA_ORIENTATION=+
MACNLAELLGAVWSAELPMAEKRRLLQGAVGRAQGYKGPGDEACSAPLARLDQLLSDAGAAAGQKASVTLVKALLRDAGAPRLASRVSRLSKGRNVAAHPDLGLEAEVLAVLRQTAGGGATSPAEADEQLTEARNGLENHCSATRGTLNESPVCKKARFEGGNKDK